MALSIIRHPLAQHYLTHLRDETTKPALFRTLARKLTTLLTLEACRSLRTAMLRISTPIEELWSPVLDADLVVVPVLRAGLGMLDAVVDLFPDVSVGYIGLERDEVTAEASAYYHKLPSLQGRTVLLIDPMLATGGSACKATATLRAGGAARVVIVCIVAAPEGVRRVESLHPEVAIYTAALDRGLDDRKFIVPGLGDFGDRLYGTN
ncbi:MAG: uracil phosphoribosyltransferase [Chthonomonadales bacterium]|nr:uracil phosphoribosyltransferase [Chthonomonadales bacterium]